ncbi:hypothetical protein [Lishizhenia sp.]|uniref:hypothetical protein n=1 Tax=Lishizhenia sp. TaxID=2497594 RepID=UPI00299D509C|nr:hypothetical protein [Lishizhenia sp.]MDX1445803.1 hypothetical protein [Lishizhenia sp.]
MRLGQLARRLSIKTDKIVKFLDESKDTQIGTHPNTKIPDEFVDDVINHFKPEPIKEMKAALEAMDEEVIPTTESVTTEEKEDTEATQIPEATPNIPSDISKKEEAEAHQEIDAIEPIVEAQTEATEIELKEEEEEELNIVDGVIKAPKQELGGVKVIGKIDLPEPKAEPLEDDTENETQEEKTVEIEKPNTKPKKQVKRKTPEQRKRQQEERRRKQELAEQTAREERKKELEQQKRKEHYLKQLEEQKAKAPAKKKKKAKPNTKKKVKKEAPKGLWKKFLYWLNDKN